MDFFDYLIFGVVLYFGFYVNWVAININHQKRQNERAGTHDYYGNRIDGEKR